MNLPKSISTLAERSWIAWSCLALLALALTFPHAINGFLPGDDTPFHMRWAHHFSTQFWNGELYPRWLAPMNADQGSPAFFYYAPVPFWATALLPPWSPTLFEDTSYQLGHATWLAVFLSGVGFFLWIRRHIGAAAALAGAAAYMILPYHVIADVYDRFAFAETWAFVWLPFLMLFAERILNGERYGRPGFALAYALLVMTHLPSALLFSPLPALYLLVHAPAERRWRVLLAGAAAYVFGLALAAIYLLPAMTMQSYVAMPNVMWSDFYDATNNFLFYGPRFTDEHRAEFWRELTQYTVYDAVMALLAGTMIWHLRERKVVLFWVGVVGVAVFMTHPWSVPVWRLVSVLRSVQFPWRFHTVLTLAVAALLAYGTHALLHRCTRWRAIVAAAIAILLVIPWPSQARLMVRNASKTFHLNPRYLVNQHDGNEYRPPCVPMEQWEKLQLREIDVADRKLAFLTTGEGSVSIVAHQPRDILLNVTTPREATVVLRQLCFPGWQAKLDGMRAVNLTPTVEGWMQFSVPAGEHTARVQLTPLPQEQAGRWISAAALAALLASLVLPRIYARVATPNVKGPRDA